MFTPNAPIAPEFGAHVNPEARTTPHALRCTVLGIFASLCMVQLLLTANMAYATSGPGEGTSTSVAQAQPKGITQAAEEHSYVPVATAFAVSSQGHLLTAYHAVRNSLEIKVFSSQYPNGARAILFAGDPERDLALLRVAVPTSPVKIATWSSVPTGLEVYALGFPQPRLQGSELKITSGLINAMEGPRGSAGFFQFSAPVQRGNSGGPVLSPDGLVVGLVQAKLSVLVGSAAKDAPQNVNFAIQSRGIAQFLAANKVASQEQALALSQSKKPHELFVLAQPSIYAVHVASATAQTKGTAEISDELRATLIALPKEEQARLYGAVKAGFSKFRIVGTEYVLVRTGATTDTSGSDPATIAFEFILSLAKPRGLPDGKTYKSMVINAQFDCSKEAMIVTRQEYKEESFGTGQTLRALKRKEDSTAEARPVKSDALREFFKTSVCEPQKV